MDQDKFCENIKLCEKAMYLQLGNNCRVLESNSSKY